MVHTAFIVNRGRALIISLCSDVNSRKKMKAELNCCDTGSDSSIRSFIVRCLTFTKDIINFDIISQVFNAGKPTQHTLETKWIKCL